MKEALHGQKIIKIGEGWSECPICHKETKVLIFVENIDESFCFYCYRNRFGLKRLMRRLREIPTYARISGFEVRESNS